MTSKPSTSFKLSVLRNLGAGVYVIDQSLHLKWFNRASPFWSGAPFPVEYGKDMFCHMVLFKKQQPCEGCPARTVIKTRQLARGETTVQCDDTMLYFSLTATSMEQANEEELLIVQVIENITARKVIENEFAQIHDLNTAIVEKAPIAITTIDKDGIFTSINPAMSKMIGLGVEAKRKVMGFRWLENPYTIKSGLAEYLKKGLAGESFTLKEFPFVTFRGDRTIFLDLQGIPMRRADGEAYGLLCIVEESTERVKTRNQLIQEAKAAVMAKLAMGVAHGINNPLATIALHSDLATDVVNRLGRKHGIGEEIVELTSYLDVIQEEAFRCKKIINSLLQFRVDNSLESEEINLGKLFDDLLGLAHFSKKSVKITRKFQTKLPVVLANLSAARQVFWNILMNALDAVAGMASSAIQVRAGLMAPDFVYVDISDNGRGICDEDRERIFTPFFSTKMPDKGIGLGLTLSEELVRKMGGTLELLKSELGKGSTFRITLPICQRP